MNCKSSLLLCLALTLSSSTLAQTKEVTAPSTAAPTSGSPQDQTDDQTCPGPIYKGKEVTRKMKLIAYPPPNEPKDSRAGEVTGEVVLDAVACSDGKIRNIEVVKGLPYGITEEAIKAAQKIKFRPAERDGEIVSQRMTFHYRFDKR